MDAREFPLRCNRSDRPLSAREGALRVLSELSGGGGTVRERIDELTGGGLLGDREVGLATELAMGVVRHRLALAGILGGLAKGGWNRTDARVRDILMVGAYQLIWLDGVPEFAAVNEAVEQAKGIGRRGQAARFVNAILRELVRQIEHRRLPGAQADPVRSIRVDGARACQFKRAIWPDPQADPIGHLSLTTSHPQWLVGRWVEAFGLDRARQICDAGTARPAVCCRPNPLRTNPLSLLTRLREEGVEADLSPAGDCVVARCGIHMTQSGAFQDGWFQPQDRTAMEIVRRMDLHPGQRVIDLCAGLGTKTTQLAEALQDQGGILACDKDEWKLHAVWETCQRLGYRIVETVLSERLDEKAPSFGGVDWILIDAPCSNTGVLGRRPEARYRVNRRTLEDLSAIQRGLMARAAGLADEHTRLAYSTCSIDALENEGVVQGFLKEHPEWVLTGSDLTLPASGPTWVDGCDGGYWAILVRKHVGENRPDK